MTPAEWLVLNLPLLLPASPSHPFLYPPLLIPLKPYKYTEVPGTRNSPQSSAVLWGMCKDALHPVTSPSWFPCYLPHLCSFGAESFIFLFFKVVGTSQNTNPETPLPPPAAIPGAERFCVLLPMGKPVAVPL